MRSEFILIRLPIVSADKQAEVEEEVSRFRGHFSFPGVTEPPLVITDDDYIEVWAAPAEGEPWQGKRLV